uniref:G_PROTEIN_RECEP_F1_2 domain-containing protein n=1 Tax=Parastrongyloides trichosuri TaxID=131310 RepID=A0A0N5A7J4_PARTI
MLSEKFQIGENIQILSMIIPMIYQLGIFNILFLGFQYTSFIDEKYKGDLMLCSNTMTLMIYGYYALNFCLKQGSLCDWRFNNSRVTRTPVVLFSNMSGRRGESTTRIYSRFLPKRSVLTVPLPVDIIEEARKRETSIDTLNYINNFESLIIKMSASNIYQDFLSNNKEYHPEMMTAIISLTTASPLLFLAPMLSFQMYKKSGWHLYYRTTTFSLLLSIFFFALGSFTCNIIVLVMGTNYNMETYSCLYTLEHISTHLLIYGPAITRVIFVIFVLERIMATLFRKKYEKKEYSFVALILFMLPFIYGINTENISDFWPAFDKYYYAICIVIDSIIIMISIYLIILNIRLRSKKFDNNICLSEKYQIKTTKLNSGTTGEEIKIIGTDGKDLNMNYDQKSYFTLFQRAW